MRAAFGTRQAGWALLGALAVVYAVAYFSHPLFPGHGAGAVANGWWTWTDQQRYLREAGAIARGALGADTYFYPVGYPVLGALFVRWLPANPFFVPDLLLVLAAAAAWWRIVTRWLGTVEALGVMAAFALTHHAVLADTVVVPWNTLATQAALLAGVAATLELAGPRRVRVLAGLAAATYVVRPVDAAAFGPLLVFATWQAGTWRARIGSGATGLGILALAVAGVAGLNHTVFGAWRTPYEVGATQTIGFFGYPASYKFFWLFVDMRPLFDEAAPALLWRFPWLFLAGPGAVWWVRREGKAAGAALAAVAVSAGLYVNYNDLLPSDLYRFNLIHYLVWWFPLLFALGAAAVLRGWRTRAVRVALGVTGAAFVAVGGLRLEWRAVPATASEERGWRLPERRPLLVRWPGTPAAETIAAVRVDGRALVEYSEYVTALAPAEAQLLLGTKATGGVLSLATDAGGTVAPEYGEGVWRWRVTPSWWRRLFPP